MRIGKSLHIMVTLLICVFLQFMSNGMAFADEGTARPQNEGVDTLIHITGYKDYSGDDGDMFLQKGDKIAVISPSALPSRKQTDAVLEGLKKWGYIPVEGKYACVKERTLEECMEDLTWALENPEIKAVFCIRGGYAASEVMDQMSMEMIKQAHKLILGYSDITIYHSAWTKLGMPSIHMSMSAAFADLPDACIEAEQKLMQGQIPCYECEADEYCQEGKAEGILIGGNLSTIIATLGTDYDPSKIDQPFILFVEDVEEDLQHIHRCMTVLKHMGVLDKAEAIIFGEWVDIPSKTSDYDGDARGGAFKSVEEMISRQFLQDSKKPVAFGFPAGHGAVNYPLLMGEMVKLTVNKDSYTLD